MSRVNHKINSAVMAVAAMLIFAGSAFAQQRDPTSISPALPPPGKEHAPVGSPVHTHGRLRVDGRNIVGEDNQPVVLRGVSFSHSAGMEGGVWYRDDVVGWMAHDWRASVVRPAMSFDSTQCAHNGTYGGPGNPGWVRDKSQWTGRARVVVEAAIRRGMYVVLDLHSYRAHNYTQAAAEFFQQVVEEFGEYPNILYEIYNEPNDVTSGRGNCPPGISAGGGGVWNNTVLNYSNTVINAIRAREQQLGYANNIIIIGNPQFSSQPNVTPAPTNAENTSWTIHFYAHSHPPSAGGGSWDPFGNMVRASDDMGRSVFATEFSHCNSTGSEPVSISNTVAWINALEQRNIGWITWSVTHKACREGTWNGTSCIGCNNNCREAASLFEPTVVASSAANWTDANPPALNDASQGGAGMLRDSIRSKNRNYYVTSWNVTTSVFPENSGTVTGGGTGFAYGAEVNLTAVPAEGWEFSHWSGDASGDNPSIPTARIRGISLNAVANFWRTNAVANGHFTLNTFRPLPSQQPAWSVGTSGDGAGAIVVENGELRVTVANPGENIGDVRVQQASINLAAGRRYELTFSARALSSRNLELSLIRAGREPDMSQPIALTTTMTDYTIAFDAGTAISNATLRFNMGGSNVAWFLDNVRIDDVGAATGAAQSCAPSAMCVQLSVSQPNSLIATRAFRATVRGRSLNVSGISGNNVEVTLFDMAGRVRFTGAATLSNGSAQLSLNRLPAGVYSVRYKVDGKTLSRADRITLAR